MRRRKYELQNNNIKDDIQQFQEVQHQNQDNPSLKPIFNMKNLINIKEKTLILSQRDSQRDNESENYEDQNEFVTNRALKPKEYVNFFAKTVREKQEVQEDKKNKFNEIQNQEIVLNIPNLQFQNQPNKIVSLCQKLKEKFRNRFVFGVHQLKRDKMYNMKPSTQIHQQEGIDILQIRQKNLKEISSKKGKIEIENVKGPDLIETNEEDAGGNRFADLQIQDLSNISQVLLDVYVDCLNGEKIDETMSLALNKYFNQFDPGCQNFISDKDYNIGDLVLQFPNPDHPEIQEELQGVTIGNKDKKRFYDTAIGLIDHDNSLEILDYRICKHAYLQVFEKLESSYSLKEKKIIRGLKRKIEIAENFFKMKKKEMYEKDDPENPVNQLHEIEEKNGGKKIMAGGGYLREHVEEIDLMAEQKKFIKEQRERRKKEKKLKKEKKMQFQVTNLTGSINNSSPRNSQSPSPQKSKKVNFSFKLQRQGRSQNTPQNKQKKVTRQQQQELGLDTQKLQLPRSNPNKQSIRSNNTLSSKTSRGSGISQQLKKEEDLILEQEQIIRKSTWYMDKNNRKTSDFMSLMRHLIWLRLTKAGFSMRHFLSRDGKYIFTVIYSNDENLKIAAQKHQMMKSLSLELSDLLSLEPVDKNLRPLRLNSSLWTDNDIEKMSLKFKYLRERIKELIMEIDFKKIIKETNGSHLNSCQFEFGEQEAVEDDTPSDKEWELYMDYLIFVRERVQRTRSKFQYSNRQAYIVNKIVEPDYRNNFNQYSMEKKLLKQKLKKMKERGKDEPQSDESLSDITISSDEYYDMKKSVLKMQTAATGGGETRGTVMSDQSLDSHDQSEENRILLQQYQQQQQIDTPVTNRNMNQNSHMKGLDISNSFINKTSQLDKSGSFYKENKKGISRNANLLGNMTLLQQSQFLEQQQQTLLTDQSEIKELLADKISNIVLEKKKNMNYQDKIGLQSAINIKHRGVKLQKNENDFDYDTDEEDQSEDMIDKKKYDQDLVQIKEELEVVNLGNLNAKKHGQTTRNNKNQLNSLQLNDNSDENFDSDRDQDELEIERQMETMGNKEFGDFNEKLTQFERVSKKKRVRCFIEGKDQKNMKKDHYIKYRSLISVLNIKSNKALHSKILKLRKREILAKEYKKVFLEGLEVVNLPYRPNKVLKNMWDVLGLKPFECHMKYFEVPKNISFKKQVKCEALWKNYQVTESGRISVFSSMERLKLAFSTVSKVIKPNFLMDNKILKNIFALNDNYELFGQSQKPLFLSFMLKIEQKKVLQEDQKKSKNPAISSNNNNINLGKKGKSNINTFESFLQLKKMQNSTIRKRQQQQNGGQNKSVFNNVRKRIQEQNKKRDLKKKLKMIEKKEKRMSQQQEIMRDQIRARQNVMLQNLDNSSFLQLIPGAQRRQSKASGQKYNFLDSEQMVRDRRETSYAKNSKNQRNSLYRVRNSVMINLSTEFSKNQKKERDNQFAPFRMETKESLVEEEEILEEERKLQELKKKQEEEEKQKENEKQLQEEANLHKTKKNQLQNDIELQQNVVMNKRYSHIRASQLHIQQRQAIFNIEVYNSPADTPMTKRSIQHQGSNSNQNSQQSITQTYDSEGSGSKQSKQHISTQNKLDVHREGFTTFTDKLNTMKKSKGQIQREKIQKSNKEFLKKLKDDKKVQMQLGSYAQKKLRNLNFLWNFQLKRPWYVPADEVRQYYGEKITLYFLFLAYYDQKLVLIGVLGIVNFIFIASFDSDSFLRGLVSFLFGGFQMLWSLSFIQGWVKKENLYAMQFGQFKKKQETTLFDNTQKRHGFIGNYQRSLIDNELNQIYYPFFERVKQYTINYGICSILIIFYCLIVLFLMYLTNLLHRDFEDLPQFFQWIRLDITFPSSLNYILIKIMEGYQKKISKFLTDKENHETIQNYETNYIQKRFLFSFSNVAFPIYAVLFINDNIGIGCVEYCFKNAQIYYAQMFILLFMENIREPMEPIIHYWIQNYKQKKNSLDAKLKEYENAILNTRFFNDGQVVKEGINMEQSEAAEKNKKKKKKKKENPFNNPKKYEQINHFIENEAIKGPFSESQDIYGTVEEFMEITIQYSFISIFGSLFPLVFIIAFIWITAELQTDKLKLIKYIQRPFPQDESSIGVWISIFEFLSHLAILTNASLITSIIQQRYTDLVETEDGKIEAVRGESPYSNVVLFLFFTFTNFGIKFGIVGFGQFSDQLLDILKRQNYIINSTFSVFKRISNHRNLKEVNLMNEKKREEHLMDNMQNQEKKSIKQYLFKEKKKDNSHLSDTQIIPIFKIFACRYFRKAAQVDLDAHDDSFQDLSSDDESSEDSDIDLENWELNLEQKTQFKNSSIYKKRQRKLWTDSKLVHHWIYVSRPFILRKLFMKRKDFLKRVREYLITKELENIGIPPKRLQQLVKEKSHHQYCVGMKGVSFDMFRRVNIRMQMSAFTSYLISTQNKEFYGHIQADLYDDVEEKQEQEIKEQEERRKQEEIIFKNQAKKLIPFDINDISFVEIEKYFSPKGKAKLVDSTLLREEKWAKVLDNRLSIQVKKMIFNKYEQELLVFCQFDQLFCEKIAFQQLRYQAQMDLQNSKKKVKLVHKLTERDQQEKKWLFLIKEAENVEEFELRTFEKQRKEREYLVTAEKLDNQDLTGPETVIMGDCYKFLSFLVIKDEFKLHMRILSEFESKNNSIEVLKNEICQIENSRIFGEDFFAFGERNHGFYARFYKEHYICSLESMVRSRKERKMKYKDENLLHFMVWLLKILKEFQKEHIHHSIIIPDNLVLTEEDPRKYRLCGTGMLYYCDIDQQKYYFTRKIEKQEEVFLPPEIVQAQKQKNSSMMCHPILSDVYMVMSCILFMMTLGDLVQESKKYKHFCIKNYIKKKEIELNQEYPLSFHIVKKIILQPDPRLRKEPSNIMEKIKNNVKTWIREPDFLISRKRNRIKANVKKHSQYRYTGSLNHFLFMVKSLLQMNMHEDCINLISKMGKSVREVYLHSFFGKSQSKSYNNKDQDQDSQSDSMSVSGSDLSESFSESERSFMSISSRQSPENLKVCTTQLYLIQIQAYMSLGKYEEAEKKLKEVEDIVEKGIEQVDEIGSKILQFEKIKSQENHLHLSQFASSSSPHISNLNSQKKFEVSPINMKNNNNRNKIINLDDIDTTYANTNRSHLITSQTDINTNSNEPQMTGSSRLLGSKTNNNNNPHLRRNQFQDDEKLLEIQEKQDSDLDEIEEGKSESGSEIQEKYQKEQQQQEEEQFKSEFKIKILDTDEQILTSENFLMQQHKTSNPPSKLHINLQAVVQQDNSIDSEQENGQGTTTNKAILSRKGLAVSRISSENQQKHSDEGISRQTGLKINLSKFGSQSNIKSSQKNPFYQDEDEQEEEKEEDEKENQGYQSRFKSSSQRNVHFDKSPLSRFAMYHQKSNENNENDSLSSSSATNCLMSQSQNFNQYPNNNNNSVSFGKSSSAQSFRSKLEHLLMNVWYLKAYCLFLRCTNGFQVQNQKEASTLVQRVKERLVKKGSGYLYLTSSLKNCVRFFNVLKLEVMFLLDTNQTKQAFNLSGYAIQCLNFDPTLETKLCQEEVPDSVLEAFRNDFIIYQSYANIYEMKHNQGFKIMKRIVQSYSDISYCAFEYKRQMYYWVLKLDLILYLNYDKLFHKLYPQFRKLLAIATNRDQEYFAFCLDLYEISTQILEFDGFKSEVAVNFLDKLDNFVMIQGGGNFYSNFLYGRYLLMLNSIKEKYRAQSLFQVAYGQLDMMQDQSEAQVYVLKERIIEILIFLSESKSITEQRFTELYAIQNTRPSRQKAQKEIEEDQNKQQQDKNEKEKSNKDGMFSVIQNHVTVQRIIRLRFFKGYFKELCQLVVEQQVKMDEQVKHQMRKIRKFRMVNNYNSVGLEDQLREMKYERMKIVDWIILINFMIGNFELIGDEIYELLKFSHLYDYIIAGLFQIIINFKIFGLYQNAQTVLQIVEKYIYFLQGGDEAKYAYSKESNFLWALLLLEEQKIDTQFTDESQFENSNLMSTILSNRYKAINHFQQILNVFNNENDNADIQQILASLYEKDGQPVMALHYYEKVLKEKQEALRKEDVLRLNFIKEAQYLEVIILKSKYGLLKLQLSQYQESRNIFLELRAEAKKYLKDKKHYLYQKHSKMEYMSMKYLYVFFTCQLLECMIGFGEITSGDHLLHFLMTQFEAMNEHQKEVKSNEMDDYVYFYMCYIAKCISSFYQAHYEYNYARDYASVAAVSLLNYEIKKNNADIYQNDVDKEENNNNHNHNNNNHNNNNHNHNQHIGKDHIKDDLHNDGQPSDQELESSISLKLQKVEEENQISGVKEEDVPFSCISIPLQNTFQKIEEVEEEDSEEEEEEGDSDSDSDDSNSKNSSEKSKNESENSSDQEYALDHLQDKLLQAQKKQREKRESMIKELRKKSLLINVFGFQGTELQDPLNDTKGKAGKSPEKTASSKSPKRFQLKDIESLPMTPVHHKDFQGRQVRGSEIIFSKQTNNMSQSAKFPGQMSQSGIGMRRLSFSAYSHLNKSERDYLLKKSYNNFENRKSILNFKSRLSLQGFKYTKYGNEMEVQKTNDIYDYILDIIDYSSFRLELQLQQAEIRSFNSKKLQHEYFNLNNVKKDIKNTKGLHSLLYAKLLVLKAQIGIGVIELQDYQSQVEDNRHNQHLSQLKKINQKTEIPQQQQEGGPVDDEQEKNEQQALFDRQKFMQEIVNCITYAKKLFKQFYDIDNENLSIKIDYFDNRNTAKAYLVDIGIQFYCQNLYEGVYAMKNVERIYSKIYRRDGHHPDVAQYLYKICPLIDKEEGSLKEYIMMILGVKEQQLEKLERFQATDPSQMKKSKKNQKKVTKKLDNEEFLINEFYVELIFELLKYNKGLHEILFKFKKQPDNLALKLKIFYIKFKKKQKFKEQQAEQSYVNLVSHQSLMFSALSLDMEKAKAQQQQQMELFQKDTEQYLRYQIGENTLSLFSLQSMNSLEQFSMHKLKEIEHQQKEDKIEKVRENREQIIKLRHSKPLKEIVQNIFQRDDEITQSDLKDILYSAQVELNIWRGFDYDQQVLEETKNGCKNLVQKAFLICKYLWGTSRSHRDNFLYSIIEHNFKKSQYNKQDDGSFKLENEFDFKMGYNRGSNSPSPKANRPNYFKFDHVD